MSGRAAWLVPLGAMPLLALGLWLWHEQGLHIWISGLVGSCF